MAVLVRFHLKTTTVQLQKGTTSDVDLLRLCILFVLCAWKKYNGVRQIIFINQNNELLLSCLYSWLHFDLTLLVLHNNHPRATKCSVLLPNCSWWDFLGIHTLLKLVRLGIVSITHKSACALLNRPRMQLSSEIGITICYLDFTAFILDLSFRLIISSHRLFPSNSFRSLS